MANIGIKHVGNESWVGITLWEIKWTASECLFSKQGGFLPASFWIEQNVKKIKRSFLSKLIAFLELRLQSVEVTFLCLWTLKFRHRKSAWGGAVRQMRSSPKCCQNKNRPSSVWFGLETKNCLFTPCSPSEASTRPSQASHIFAYLPISSYLQSCFQSYGAASAGNSAHPAAQPTVAWAPSCKPTETRHRPTNRADSSTTRMALHRPSLSVRNKWKMDKDGRNPWRNWGWKSL